MNNKASLKDLVRADKINRAGYRMCLVDAGLVDFALADDASQVVPK